MKHIVALLFIFSLFSKGFLFSQNTNDSILVVQNIGTVFIQNERVLRANDMLEIMKVNTLAYEEMKTAKKYGSIASTISFAGGFFIGYSLVSSVTSREIKLLPAAVGIGLTVLSVPFTLSYTKHASNAVYIFNRDLPYKSYGSLEFNFGFTQGGIGLSLRF